MFWLTEGFLNQEVLSFVSTCMCWGWRICVNLRIIPVCTCHDHARLLPISEHILSIYTMQCKRRPCWMKTLLRNNHLKPREADNLLQLTRFPLWFTEMSAKDSDQCVPKYYFAGKKWQASVLIITNPISLSWSLLHRLKVIITRSPVQKQLSTLKR